MRTLQSTTLSLVAIISMSAGAQAQTNNLDGTPIVVPSQSSVFNQNGVNLPSAPSVNGSDSVRGSTGLSCQSAIASGGPYMDLGVIGAQDVYSRDTAAVYGRIVVPLGKRPKRVDCTKLYDLEITRLKMELELMRMGMGVPTSGVQPAAMQPMSAPPVVTSPAAPAPVAQPTVEKPAAAPTVKPAAVKEPAPKPRTEPIALAAIAQEVALASGAIMPPPAALRP